jgi:hypothetical protein
MAHNSSKLLRRHVRSRWKLKLGARTVNSGFDPISWSKASWMSLAVAAKQDPVAHRLALADLSVPRKDRAPADAALKSA